ncbi:putative maltase, partial [Armadillidium vulgare]
LSAFRYSAWEWSEERKQFYLHQYLKEQPDLNYRNPEVVEEMNNIVRFWLDRGVDGFRVDALQRLFEVDDVYGADEPVAIDSGITDPTIHKYLDHIYTRNQPETFEVTRGWYEILKSYEDRVMMVEVYDKDIQQVMKFYGNDSYTISDIPFNLLLNSKVRSAESMTGINLKNTIELWLNNMPKGKWPNWVGWKMFLFHMRILKIQLDVTEAQKSTRNQAEIPKDLQCSGMRPKMQNETEQSHIKVYKDLTRLRLKRTFQFGTLNFQIATKDVLAFIRSCKECPMYLIVINTSKKDIIIDVQNGNLLLPDSATVVIRSSSDTRNETTVG